MSDALRLEEPGLAEFHNELARAHIRGQWQSESTRKSSEGIVQRPDGGFDPPVTAEPYIWPWRQLKPLLEKSCVAVPESLTARRSLALNNPGLTRSTTQTIVMAVQTIRPGEIAWAHRHTIAALRFAIEGSPSLATTVNGKICQMNSYDLVLTPPWSWHDHENKGAEPVSWLDVLDSSLITSLNQFFYEPLGRDKQISSRAHESNRSDLADIDQFIGANSPERLHFPWSEVEPILVKMRGCEGSPYDGIILDYVQPDGSPTMPSLGCSVQLLRPNERTKRHRHSSSSVYFVVRGSGVTKVGDQSLQWQKHDCFVVPNWLEHDHQNRSQADDAVLFSVSDAPLLRYLGLLREEPKASYTSSVKQASEFAVPRFNVA